MGNICCLKRQPKRKITLLLVGLDNAGKTVAAKNLAGEDVESVMPTVGFSIVHLTYKNHNVDLFDLGGSSNIRGIWDKYFVYAHGVIYVVDSSDYKRLEEAKQVLHKLVSHEKISGKPLIILANKQDYEEALDEIDMIEKLQLEDLVNNKQCPTLVESCAASETTSKSKLDPGIKKAYHWLLNYIIREYNDLNLRVETDVKEQEKIENEIRLETINRIKLKQAHEKTTDDDVIELYSDYNKKLNGISQHSPTKLSNNTNVSSDVEYIRKTQESKPERPKSAVQMVKEQLELEQTKRKSPLKLSVSNKTAPANLFGIKMPHSANIHKREQLPESRNLKSAGDSIFIVSNLPNSVSTPSDRGDLFQTDLFHVNNFEQKKKLPPLQIEKNYNAMLRGNVNDDNAISIVEIE